MNFGVRDLALGESKRAFFGVRYSAFGESKREFTSVVSSDYYQTSSNLHLNLIFKPIDQGIYYLEHFDTHPLSSLQPLEVCISSSDFVGSVQPSDPEGSLGLE